MTWCFALVRRNAWLELTRFLARLFCCELGGWFFWFQSFSSVHHRSNGVLLSALQRTWAVRSRRERRVDIPCNCAAAHATLWDKNTLESVLVSITINTFKHCVCVRLEILTCVLISCGIVCCLIQGWTPASSSLCSWLNQGWRGWRARSFSLSSANTSFWSLEKSGDKI